MTSPDVFVKPLTKRQAGRLTERIRESAIHTWDLLLEARDRQAWKVMGYETWTGYVDAEFGMTAGNAWRLLLQAQVIRELGEAADLSPRDLARLGDGAPPLASGQQAQQIRSELPEVTAEIKDRTVGKPPDERAAEAKAVVQERVRKKGSRKPGTAKPDPIEATATEKAFPAAEDGSTAGAAETDSPAADATTQPERPPKPVGSSVVAALLASDPKAEALKDPSAKGLENVKGGRGWWDAYEMKVNGLTSLKTPAGAEAAPSPDGAAIDIGEAATIFLRALKAVPAESHSVKVWEQFNRDLASKSFEAINAKTKALKGIKK